MADRFIPQVLTTIQGVPSYIVYDQKWQCDADAGFTAYSYDEVVAQCAKRNALQADEIWTTQTVRMPMSAEVERATEL